VFWGRGRRAHGMEAGGGLVAAIPLAAGDPERTSKLVRALRPPGDQRSKTKVQQLPASPRYGWQESRTESLVGDSPHAAPILAWRDGPESRCPRLLQGPGRRLAAGTRTPFRFYRLTTPPMRRRSRCLPQGSRIKVGEGETQANQLSEDRKAAASRNYFGSCVYFCEALVGG